MASNSLGNIFRFTTWGESHGKAIGVVIDGCPSGISLSNEDINNALFFRSPGRNAFVSPRSEKDLAEIYSGVFEGKTTGAPISIIIFNKDADSSAYDSMKNLIRPGHANLTYLKKYGVFDYRGGGRASARETACRVAAGAVAQKILNHVGIQTCAYLSQMGEIKWSDDSLKNQNAENATAIDLKNVIQKIQSDPLFCPDSQTSQTMQAYLENLKIEGDSIGGVVSFYAKGLPMGLGDPVYEKLEANLAHAMLSIPASKGFEIGEGFNAVTMQGSMHNKAHHSGGVLGGISNGEVLFGRVAFKPTSSIKKPQETQTLSGDKALLQLSENSRHDPCVAIRAVPVVEAMLMLVLADAVLMQGCVRVEHLPAN